MNPNPSDTLVLLLLFTCFSLASCQAQETTTIPQDHNNESVAVPVGPSVAQAYKDPFKDLNIEAQLMQVVRRVFQDSNGNLWIVGDDVYCYAGDSLIDLSDQEVFRKTVVRQIREDQEGNLWFGTHMGLVKYQPSVPPTGTGTEIIETDDSRSSAVGAFRIFSDKDGLIDNDIWSLAIDSKGIVWIGTLQGVCRFDGQTFTSFDIPESEPDPNRGVTSARIVHSIMEDHSGRMWFATNGGVYIYDPSSESGAALSHISEEDGLCNKMVNDILEDENGNIWFATHYNGVCRYEPSTKTFARITTADGEMGTESWSLYEDRIGNIWFPVEHDGIYRYEPTTESLTNYHKADGLPLNVVHSIAEDAKGRFWLGGFGGLYRYDPGSDAHRGQSFVNVTAKGPWQ